MFAIGSRLRNVALVSLMAAAGGCTSLGPMPELRLPFTGKKEKICPQPTRLAVTWSPDVLVQTGATPTRGFGGRIFFYDNSGQAVRVDGDLMVHAFGNDGVTPGQTAKRYAFTPEQFKTHASESDIGDSYSVWIPWDAAGGLQQRITLVATFTPCDGKPIQSGASVALLPGRTPDTTHAAKHGIDARRVRQVAHLDGGLSAAQHPSPAPATADFFSNGLSTTTIPLPSSTQKLLRTAQGMAPIQRRPPPTGRRAAAQAPGSSAAVRPHASAPASPSPTLVPASHHAAVPSQERRFGTTSQRRYDLTPQRTFGLPDPQRPAPATQPATASPLPHSAPPAAAPLPQRMPPVQ